MNNQELVLRSVARIIHITVYSTVRSEVNTGILFLIRSEIGSAVNLAIKKETMRII